MKNKGKNKSQLYDSMHSTARSALRMIYLHNLFSQVPLKEQYSLKTILKRELRIMLLRIFKLYAHLLIYIKKN